ncbi:hypothetical protein [Actinokineospora terrae]|uniref:Uncharacterized protein n=1 Tax=Actinokineospora terrae TaxID=155974 RepID=A0A1H9MGC8_9PSEU|nr:hypothetical protein [Actinokineospora terrae]SER22708.1 hypothetical protein SAMN04487818_102146 [Actinokineospora terrae]
MSEYSPLRLPGAVRSPWMWFGVVCGAVFGLLGVAMLTYADGDVSVLGLGVAALVLGVGMAGAAARAGVWLDGTGVRERPLFGAGGLCRGAR